MKKVLLTALAFCSVALAQQTPTIAVMAVGEGDPDNKKILETLLGNELRRGGYVLAVRDTTKLGAIGQEHIYMRGGAVDNVQIAEAGKQYGAKCMCVVSLTRSRDDDAILLLAASIVDVERAVQTAEGSAKLRNLVFSEIEAIVPKLSGELLSSDMCGQKFGFLEVKPAYLGDIGKDKNWSLSFDGKPVYSLGNKLSIGRHKMELGHECYSDINANIEIAKDIEIFNVSQGDLKLKEGLLDLDAVSETNKEKVVNGVAIYANGKKIGSTPYSGPVPVCSKIEVGSKRKALEDLRLEYMGKVKYTYETNEKPKTLSTYIWAASLNVVGLGLLYASYKYHKDAQDIYLGNYQSLRGNANYDEAFQTLRNAEYARNGFFVTGIISLAVGGYLWF